MWIFLVKQPACQNLWMGFTHKIFSERDESKFSTRDIYGYGWFSEIECARWWFTIIPSKKSPQTNTRNQETFSISTGKLNVVVVNDQGKENPWLHFRTGLPWLERKRLATKTCAEVRICKKQLLEYQMISLLIFFTFTYKLTCTIGFIIIFWQIAFVNANLFHI